MTQAPRLLTEKGEQQEIVTEPGKREPQQSGLENINWKLIEEIEAEFEAIMKAVDATNSKTRISKARDIENRMVTCYQGIVLAK